MAQPTRRYFTALTGLAQNALDEISLQRLLLGLDRVIWEVHGSVGQFDIRLKEIFNQSGRMYSYYIINAGQVVVGFELSRSSSIAAEVRTWFCRPSIGVDSPQTWHAQNDARTDRSDDR